MNRAQATPGTNARGANPLAWALGNLVHLPAANGVRFGGVAGKVAYIALGCLVAVAVVAWRRGVDLYVFGTIVVILIFGFLVCSKILAFAQANPELATLEGAEILRWQEQSIAAKGLPQPPASLPVEGKLLQASSTKEIT